jgi:hypothetical protein
MKAGTAKRERGVVLIAMVAVIALAASWLLVRQLNAESGSIDAARKSRNAAILNKAKQTLIGYVAAQAAMSGENRPGALPCPEAPGNFNDPLANGSDGTVSFPCTPPIVGRFPWRSLGLDQLVDASGEPLWYAVASGWAGASTVINSNCAYYNVAGLACQSGRLSVDGVAVASSDVIAVIIAPGPVITVSTSANCTAWTQTRPTTAPPDWRNYLECQNATNPADNTFATTGPSGSFNDQLIKITTAELLPAIEAAIAHRIEREVAPLLRSMYSGGSWSGSAATPRFPFAAAFADPSSALTTYKGVSGTFNGLLPLSYSETSPGSEAPCVAAASPRCQSAFVAWINAPAPTFTRLGGAQLFSANCSIVGTSVSCTIVTSSSIFAPANTIQFAMSGTAANVGMALRQLNPAATMSGISAGPAVSGTLNDGTGAAPAGSATVTVTGSATVGSGGTQLADLLCGLGGFAALLFDCYSHTVSFPIYVLADHPILDSTSTGTNQGWFLRNKWHEVSYYAVATGHAPNGAASCTTGGTCLTVNYHRDATNTVDAGKQRAIIILSGRSLTGTARPNGTIADWLEGANTDGLTPFELRSATLLTNRTFNDRFAVIDSN